MPLTDLRIQEVGKLTSPGKIPPFSEYKEINSNAESAPTSATIPIYTETTLPNITEDGKKLIKLYKDAGVTLPNKKEEYPTSWNKKQIDGNYQKSFTYAHAKTVYTDYANKVTLADKLLEINTNIDNMVLLDTQITD